jgi:heat shock protein HslJ
MNRGRGLFPVAAARYQEGRKPMKMKYLAAAALSGLTTACVTVAPPGSAPGALVGKEWAVNEVAGLATIPNARPSLIFTTDGRLAGSTSCNRLLGNYTTSGYRLTIRQGGTTMMACPPAVMQQERRFLDVLNGVRFYRIDPSGQLILLSRYGPTIKAR